MSGSPAFMFYPGDWLRDECLQKCTPATKGIWMDLLCLMHLAEPRGTLTGTMVQLARLCRVTEAEMTVVLKELNATQTSRVTFRDGEVTVENRRMSREENEKKNHALRQQRYRERKESDAKVTPPSSSSSSSSLQTPNGVRDLASARSPPCPFEKIVEIYHEILPELPRVEVIESRKANIRARWKQMPSLDDWRVFFEIVRDSKFLMGKVPPSNGRSEPFRASFGWLVKPENFANVVEHKYDR